jgi:hypothetical protein
MFVVDFITALLIAFALSVIFAGTLRTRGFRRFGERSLFFILVLLGSWAGGIWLVAFGPVVSGTHWLPFVAAGVIVALTTLALMQIPEFSASVHAAEGRTGDGQAAPLAIGLYFWISLLILMVAISARYLWVHLP